MLEDENGPASPLLRQFERLRRSHRPVGEPWQQLIASTLPMRTLCIDLVLLLMGAGTVLIAWFQPWNNSPRIPIRYVNDGLFYSMNIQTIVEDGWMQSSDRLGAPFGQELYDFPLGGDNGNYLILKTLTWFTDDFGLMLNLFYFLGFALVAVVTYVCARMLNTARALALTVAVLFTFAPYHFLRAGHVMLANYAVIPIGVLLAIRAATGHALVRGDRSLKAPTGWALACIALGSFGAYYMVFTVVTIVMMSVVSAACNRSTRPITAAGTFISLIGCTFLINVSSSIFYRRANGLNEAVETRGPADLDGLAFRLIQTLTPPPGSRLPFVGERGGLLDEGLSVEPTMHFGVIGSVALVAMLASVARVIVFSADRAENRPTEPRTAEPLLGLITISTLAWILIASAGGLNWLFPLMGFDRIRGWGRVSILILFIVLIWAAHIVSASLHRRTVSRPVLALILTATCAVGLADQVTDNPIPGQFDGDYLEDRALFTQIERDLPIGASVAQVPYIPFPAVGLNDSRLYDPVRPFLHTSDLRFSYGGMRGREADWQAQIDDLSTAQQIDAFLALGFEAILAHRPAYIDRGAQVIADFEQIAPGQVLLTERGSWIFLPLDRALSDLSDTELSELRNELLGAELAAVVEAGNS